MSRIIESLKQAVRYARGDKSVGRSTLVRVPKPKHGEVRRHGDNAYVWDGNLECWIQTRYADEQS